MHITKHFLHKTIKKTVKIKQFYRPKVATVLFLSPTNQNLPFPLWLITASVSRQNAVCCLWARLKSCFSFSPLWRTSGSTTWIWRKPTRNKGPTGGWNTPCPRLLDWLTCGRRACWGWDSASCHRARPASLNTSATSWSATTAASSARAAARWTRFVLSSTWTSPPTPSAPALQGDGGCNEPFLFFIYIYDDCTQCVVQGTVNLLYKISFNLWHPLSKSSNNKRQMT